MRKKCALMLCLLVGIVLNLSTVTYSAAPQAGEALKATVPTMVYYDTSYVIYKNAESSTELKFGARVKADFYYDVDGKQPGPTYGLDPAAIPLHGWDSDAKRRGNFNISLTPSRISFEGKQKCGCVNALGYIELDFNGGLSSGVRTSNSYTPRIRHAYGDFSDLEEINNLLIGQTWTNFATPEVNPYSTDNLWPSFRVAQVRYTRKFASGITLAIAAERPNTQSYYYTQAVRSNVGYYDNDTAGTFNKSSMPDFTMRLKYHQNVNYFALRGVVRRLEIKEIDQYGASGGQNSAFSNFQKKKVGWGLGVSAMFKIFNPLTFMAQVQGGQGIGRYIDDLSNQNPLDSYFQYPSSVADKTRNMFQALKAINFIAGFTINWGHDLETNIGGAYTKVKLPNKIALISIPAPTVANSNTPLINRKLQRYHVNLIYRFISKTFFILEAEQYYRKAGRLSKHTGKDTRFVFSLIRNF